MGIFSRKKNEPVVRPQAPSDDKIDEANSIDATIEREIEEQLAQVSETVHSTTLEVEAGIDHATSQSRASNTHLDMFLEGFDDLTDAHEVFDTTLMNIRSRTKAMAAYSQTLKKDAARSAEAFEQVRSYQKENTHLQAQVDKQQRKILDLESALSTSMTNTSALRSELDEVVYLKSELEGSIGALEEVSSTLHEENEHISIRLAEKEGSVDRMAAEIEGLRSAKSSATVELRQAVKELSEAKSKLSELELQQEKLTQFQNTLISDREKASEERRNMRREMGGLESKYAETQLKHERVLAENKELLGRLATEKFSTRKQHEAMVSELALLRERNTVADKDLDGLREQLLAERAEREAERREMMDNTASLEDGRKNLSKANLSISELNLKYSTDRLTLDQMRDENKELRSQIRGLTDEKAKLSEYEVQARTANLRADKLEERLADFVDGLNEEVPQSKKEEINAEAEADAEAKSAEPDSEDTNVVTMEKKAATPNGPTSSAKH